MRKVVLALVALATLVGSATAVAHIQQEQGNELAHRFGAGGADRGQCLGALSRITHGNYDKGFVRSTNYSSFYNGPSPCRSRKYRNPGKLWVKLEFYHWNRKHQRWHPCWWTDWWDNPENTWVMSIYKDFQTTPCGHDYYQLKTRVTTRYNHDWLSGELWSQPHHLPVSGNRSAANPNSHHEDGAEEPTYTEEPQEPPPPPPEPPPESCVVVVETPGPPDYCGPPWPDTSGVIPDGVIPNFPSPPDGVPAEIWNGSDFGNGEHCQWPPGHHYDYCK